MTTHNRETHEAAENHHGRRWQCFVAAFFVAFFGTTAARATIIELGSLKDNTLYDDGGSNGAGKHFFSGVTAQSDIRRGLIAFDVGGTIPPDSTINSVALTLNMSRTQAGAEDVELRRVLAEWGEGTSNAPGEEGVGTSASAGSATWTDRFFNTTPWSTAGGDFSTTVSASQSVGSLGSYTWGSTASMVADVQTWLDTPSSNFGWLLLGNESETQTAKRFDTHENPTLSRRPTLVIDYTDASPFAPIPVPPSAIYSIRDDDSDSVFDDLGDAVVDQSTASRSGIGEIDSAGTNRINRIVAKFLLPEPPVAAPVLDSATLRLFLEDTAGTLAGPVSLLHSVGDNDLDQLVTDYENPSYVDTLLDLVEPTDVAGQFYESDVTDLVLADYAADGFDPLSAFRLQVSEAVFIEDNQHARYRLTMPGGAFGVRPELVLSFAAVPEPSTLALAALALFTLLAHGHRRSRA